MGELGSLRLSTDPFTPNLKVDLLPEINLPPRILSKYTTALNVNKTFKQELDNYLKTAQPYTFLHELRSKLLLPQGQVSSLCPLHLASETYLPFSRWWVACGTIYH